MKKVLSLIIAAIVVLGVVSCGGGNKSKAPAVDTNATQVMDAVSNEMEEVITNVTTEEDKMEAKAADSKTKTAVKKLEEKDSGALQGLD